MPIGRLLRRAGRFVSNLPGLSGVGGALTLAGTGIGLTTSRGRANIRREAAAGSMAISEGSAPALPALPSGIPAEQLPQGMGNPALQAAAASVPVPGNLGVTVQQPLGSNPVGAFFDALSPSSPGGIGIFPRELDGNPNNNTPIFGSGPGTAVATVEPPGPASVFSILGTSAGRGRGKALQRELLIQSGVLLRAGFIQPPIQFTAPNGAVKNGSYKGWVIINMMHQGQRIKFQMPKVMAREFGFWKPRKKPVISVEETQAIRKAERAKRKVKMAAQKSGLYVANKRPETPKKPATRRRR